jgi:uncharacterized membrane protein YjfL (UPF0719 family)
MFELAAQALAYSGIGLAILVAGYFVVDVLTPGHLGRQVSEGNPNAAILVSAALISLGLIEYFAIYFTGAGWSGLDDALVFGLLGVVVQAVGFVILDLVTPGKLGATAMSDRFHPVSLVAASAQIGIALIVCASLT